MPYDTDQRLKSYLDTNQLGREQMSLAILSLDKRFTDVRPRHPRGGPDGGRDIEAIFSESQRAFGAVGFVNQADDTPDKKTRVQVKFRSDLKAALAAKPQPEVFVFFTNVNFTIGEKDTLSAETRSSGFAHCEIFDRERLRIALDSTDGLAIRYQYLQIPLAEAEQAAFFARWGSDIQSVISTGFQEVHRTLNRLMFLQESQSPLSWFGVRLNLDRKYSGDDIGHFRAFCELLLKEPKHGIISILFGSTDKSRRMFSDEADESPGIAAGISGGQWVQRMPEPTDAETDDGSQDTGDDVVVDYKCTVRSSSVGRSEVAFITIAYSNHSLIRFEPTFTLRDFDEGSFALRINRSLASKVRGIEVLANQYKLLEISDKELQIDDRMRPTRIPIEFSSAELSDPWVYIGPKGTFINIEFSDQTPQRLFAPREITQSNADVPQ